MLKTKKLQLSFLALLIFILALFAFSSCDNNEKDEISSESSEIIKETSEESIDEESSKEEQKVIYENITAEEAKNIMDTQKGYIILDVRTQEEYNEGHIKGAILIPYDEIETKANQILKDKNQLLLVYCRSGRRSKIASETLKNMGYTNIKEFGGIIDWKYEIVK